MEQPLAASQAFERMHILCLLGFTVVCFLCEQALKNYTQVIKHFDDYFEGSFDYHNYCMRKATLSSYKNVRKL